MNLFKNKYRIKSARLAEWDYSNPWWYYVTINTKDHKDFLGKVRNGKMIVNGLGRIAENCWKEIPNHYPASELDYFVVMPNHIHGIIIINSAVETGHAPSLQRQTRSLSNIIGSFKSGVTKSVHNLGYTKFGWQPRFYDRIIRNEKELYNIRKYIEQNPLNWELEREQPENIFE
ncbi:MAG: transposase [Bacteroidetes bacterium]|nr:transposase [Bacteroidota bacterium]